MSVKVQQVKKIRTVNLNKKKTKVNTLSSTSYFVQSQLYGKNKGSIRNTTTYPQPPTLDFYKFKTSSLECQGYVKTNSTKHLTFSGQNSNLKFEFEFEFEP